MKKLFFAIAAMVSLSAGAQTVDEVVDKYVEAMGGAEKLNSIKSLYIEGVTSMGQMDIVSVIYKQQSKMYRRETSMMGNLSYQIVTEKEGWNFNPMGGSGKAEAMTAEAVAAMQNELDCNEPLFDYKAKGHTAELVGKELIDGKEVYKIKLTLKNGQEISYFIDTKTNYIVRKGMKGGAAMAAFGGMRGGARGGPGGGPGGSNFQIREGGGGEGGQPLVVVSDVVAQRNGGGNPQGGTRQGGPGGADREMFINYSDYKKTKDGYVFAYTQTFGGTSMGLTYEKIEVNNAKKFNEKLAKPHN